MNLSYEVTEDEMRDLFGQHGGITHVEIPFRKGGRGTKLGLAFISFDTSESAISAYAELDQKYFQGRKLHIKPAERKPYQEPKEPYEPWNKPWNPETNPEDGYTFNKDA